MMEQAKVRTRGHGMAEIRCVTAGEGRFALEAVAVLMPRGITVTAATPEFADLLCFV
jgi:hypothetical protein